MKRVTIKDVANEAGVSFSTVSHVLNNTRYVEPATAQRVREAIQVLNYSPNIIARSLKGGKTKTIGLIIPDTSNLFFAEITRKIEDFGFQKGYSVIIGNSDNDSEKQSNYINTLITKQVDGVIFISSDCKEKDLDLFLENKIPVVVADRDFSLEFADVVLLDNESGGYQATRHLLELGHKVIGCITGPNFLSPSMQRVEGYKKALIDYGVAVQNNLIKNGDFHFKGGGEAMEALLIDNPGLSAVFALNDMMAIGAMRVARNHNLRLPYDLSIIGFDDIELAKFVTPSLSSISQPIKELSSYAVNLLIERIEGHREINENKRIVLSPTLANRDSTIRRV